MTDTPEMYEALLAERDTRIAELEQRLAELLAEPAALLGLHERARAATPEDPLSRDEALALCAVHPEWCASPDVYMFRTGHPCSKPIGHSHGHWHGPPENGIAFRDEEVARLLERARKAELELYTTERDHFDQAEEIERLKGEVPKHLLIELASAARAAEDRNTENIQKLVDMAVQRVMVERERAVTAERERDESKLAHQADLLDLGTLVDHLSRTYDHFSGGRISKPMTFPEEVFSVAEEFTQESILEAVIEATEEITGERDELRERLARLEST